MSAASGNPPPTRAGLHQVATNVDLGTALLARLLGQYDGSAVILESIWLPWRLRRGRTNDRT